MDRNRSEYVAHEGLRAAAYLAAEPRVATVEKVSILQITLKECARLRRQLWIAIGALAASVALNIVQTGLPW